MSPEQARHDPLDPRADIYAVGVLLYRMVAGRLPFRGKAFMKVLSMHMYKEPPRPRYFASERSLTDAAEALILTSLAKFREERYQSADDLGAALRATLPPETAFARPSRPVRAAPAPQSPAPQGPAPKSSTSVSPTPGSHSRGRGWMIALIVASWFSALFMYWAHQSPAPPPITAVELGDEASGER